MIDFHTGIASILGQICPTYYEMLLTPSTATPCITYMELTNYQMQETGNTLGYSTIDYQIKVWDNSIKNIQEIVPQIDDAMRQVGFKRISTNEMTDRNGSMIQKILVYECIALENY